MSDIRVLPTHMMRRVRTVFKGVSLFSHDDSEQTRGMTKEEKKQFYQEKYIESQKTTPFVPPAK